VQPGDRSDADDGRSHRVSSRGYQAGLPGPTTPTRDPAVAGLGCQQV
jgi:hypothetical protein